MTTFEVRMRHDHVEIVHGVDAYELEGPLTTFFALGEGRTVVDCWATRVASIRTADIVMVRRRDPFAVVSDSQPDESIPAAC